MAVKYLLNKNLIIKQMWLPLLIHNLLSCRKRGGVYGVFSYINLHIRDILDRKLNLTSNYINILDE